MKPETKSRIIYWAGEVVKTALCILAGLKVADWIKS